VLLEIILGVDGKVVFRLARYHAGLTAGATVQVHHHAPFVRYSVSYHLFIQLAFPAYSSGFRQSPRQGLTNQRGLQTLFTRSFTLLR
jgi:hypothetical protein